MTASTHPIRRGLPRVRGGNPWPPAIDRVAIDGAVIDPAVVRAVADQERLIPTIVSTQHDDASELTELAQASLVSRGCQARDSGASTMRRGLPRVAGGEPWPHVSTGPVPAAIIRVASTAGPAPTAPAPQRSAVRRGLPRIAGGPPWPAETVVPEYPPARTSTTTAKEPSAGVAVPAAIGERDSSATTTSPEAVAVKGAEAATTEVAGTASAHVPLEPLGWTRTAWPGEAASTRPPPRPVPSTHRGLTKAQWFGAVVLAGGALLVAALAVTLTRWVVSLEFLRDFLTAYPGETHLPEGAPVGIPTWLGWQHFFNLFLMVLIIRSGWQVHTEQRPPIQWSPRWNAKRKISITLWLHQSLDLLWIANGAIFVALLLTTGQWMRVVPTSWEVFPNALSAAIQYVSLDWPTENGWVNYNSLQVLAYFTTIFVAAPLAFVTGLRMSGGWPKNAARLNALYPVEWARAIHLPVMLYFVAFIIVHVALVLATGALRNLNHIYATQGSRDPTAYATNWTGFWIFSASLFVIIAGWVAARPIVLGGIARAFGNVSQR